MNVAMDAPAIAAAVREMMKDKVNVSFVAVAVQVNPGMRLHSFLIASHRSAGQCSYLLCTVNIFLPGTHQRTGWSTTGRALYTRTARGVLHLGNFMAGLSVYDGARFINYTTEDGLITSLVNDIVEMGDDSLWIPNGPGLHALVHGILRT